MSLTNTVAGANTRAFAEKEGLSAHEITSIAQLQGVLGTQREAFKADNFPTYGQRISDLKALKKILLNNQQDFIESLSDDFGHRSEDDSRIGDILTTVMGINYSIKRLKSWMKPQKKHIGILFQPAKGKVCYQPLGVVGIIAPGNYPLFLSLGPLTAALAAGNRAMLKMSEYTPKTNALLASLLAKEFSRDKVAVVTGEVDMASAFSTLTFDHIFFTGSTQVGRLVMQAAAKNLVPVTLELGGKSPAIIADDIEMKTAVTRLILGKTLNSGQTCVAPDYVFCPQDKVPELYAELKRRYLSMYPTINNNPDCTGVINQQQFSRLNGLLQDAKEKGALVMPMSSDKGDSSKRQIPLTVVSKCTDDMKLLQDEIFGPILPIIPYQDMREVVEYINQRPRPLALYLYSFNKKLQKSILTQTHAGGVCINDAAFHVVNDDLPFGGVGESGVGSYHGDEGFKTFSHAKSVFSRGRISLAPLLFPPFGSAIQKMVYKLFIR